METTGPSTPGVLASTAKILLFGGAFVTLFWLCC